MNDEVEKELRERNEERYDMVEEEPKSWTRRIELPTFEGIDPHRWVARAEKFFEIQHITNKEKLKISFINMEGGTNHWFNF